jgi:hypothetical protein
MQMATKTASHNIAGKLRHAEWKHGKVMRGLAQAKDRKSLIPAKRVWRNLGLES